MAKDVLITPASGKIELKDDNVTNVYISEGNVGIGTDDPDYLLDVEASSGYAYSRTVATANSQRAFGIYQGKDGSGNVVDMRIGAIADATQGGIFTFTNHKLTFATNNASPQMTLDTSGRLGIGVSPSAALDVSPSIRSRGCAQLGNYLYVCTGATTGHFLPHNPNTGGGYWRWGQSDNSWGVGGGKFLFVPDSDDFANATVTFQNDGKVGIGTTTPVSKLSVVGGSAIYNCTGPGLTTGTIHLDPNDTTDHTGNSITWGATDDSYTGATDKAQAGIYVVSAGSYGTKMFFGTTNSYASGVMTRMLIDASGNVGIGTASPSDPLEIFSTGSGLVKRLLTLSNHGTADATAGRITFEGKSSTSVTKTQATIVGCTVDSDNSAFTSKLLFSTRTADAMVIDTNGNVGIGTPSPDEELVICKNQNAPTAISFKNTDTNSSAGSRIYFCESSTKMAYMYRDNNTDKFHFKTYDGTTYRDVMVLCEGGNVGIGTDTPSVPLHVSGITCSSWFCADTGVCFKSSTACISLNQHYLDVRGASGAWCGFSAIFRTASGDNPNSKWVGIGATNDHGWLSFASGADKHLVLCSDGKVGIGTDSPAKKLHICSVAETQVKIQSNGSSRASIALYTQHNEANDIFFGTNGDEDRFSLSGRGSSNNHELIMYSNNAGWQALQTWHFDCDVVSFPSGCVGIGTASPSKTLEVAGQQLINSSSPELDLNNTGAGTNQKRWRHVVNSSGTYTLQTTNDAISDGQVAMCITRPAANINVGNIIFPNGNVGIGTAPSVKLDIDQDGNPSGSVDVLRIQNSDGAGIGEEHRIKWKIDTRDIAYIGASYLTDVNGGGLTFATRQGGTVTETMRLDENGYVGIGTTDPQNLLHVRQVGTSGNSYYEGAIQAGGASSALGGIFGYSALGSGRVNISSLNNDGGANATIKLGFGAITSGEPANTVMTVNQSGRVGIGTADPSYLLHVKKSSGNSIIASESGDNAGDLYLIGNRTSDNDTSNLTFYNSSEPIARIRAYRHGANDAGKLTFATQATGGNPVEHMTICPDGKVCATGAFYGHLYGVDLKITGTSCFQQNICLQGGNRAVVVPSGYGALQAGSCENVRFCTNGIVYVNSTLCTGDKWKVTEDGITSWGGSQAQGTLTWDTGKAVVGGLSGNDLSLIADGSSKLFICTGGNVGIGTTTPGAVIPADSDTTNLLEIQSRAADKDSGLRIVRFADDVVGFDLWVDGGASTHDTYFDNRYEASDFIFRSGTRGSTTKDEVMRVTGEGTLSIGSAGGNSDVSLSRVSTRQLRIDSGPTTGTAMTVHIGPDGSGSMLKVHGESLHPNNAGILFSDTSSSTLGIKSDTSDRLTFRTGGSWNRMVIDSNGKVGIGEATPAESLHIGTGGKLKLSRPGNDRHTCLFTDNSGTQLKNDGGDPIFICSANYTEFQTMGCDSYAMRIKGYKIGIGTGDPDSKIHINGDSGLFRLERSSVGEYDTKIDNSFGSSNTTCALVFESICSSGGFQFCTKNSSGTAKSAMGIDRDGNVGIGVNGPDATLHVNGNLTLGADGAWSNCKLNVHGSIYMPAGNNITWSNGNADIVGGPSGTICDLLFRTWTGSALTEKLRITGGGVVCVCGWFRQHCTIGTADNVRNGVASYDTTNSYAAGVGGQLVLGYIYNSSGTYTEGAIVKMCKLNATSGDYASGLKFQVRCCGENLATKMTLRHDGQLHINANSPNSEPYSTICTYDTQHGGLVVNVASGKQAHVRFQKGGNTCWQMRSCASADTLSFYSWAGSCDWLVICNNGNVGIGTTSPSSKLNVDGVVRVCSDTGGYGTGGQAVELSVGSAKGYIGSYDRSNSTYCCMVLYASQYEFQSGNVGIGTTTPEAKLDIQSGNIALVMGADNGATTLTNSTTKTARMGVHHYTNSEEPTTVFVVDSTATSNTLMIGGGTGHMNSTSYIKFLTAENGTTTTGTERMRIDNDGKLCICGNVQMGASTKLFFNNNTTYGVGAGGNNFNSIWVDTLESGSNTDWLELAYYCGHGVRIGQGVNGSKSLYANQLYQAGNRVVDTAGKGLCQSASTLKIDDSEKSYTFNSGATYIKGSLYVGSDDDFDDRGDTCGDAIYLRHPVKTSGGWWGNYVEMMSTVANHTATFQAFRYRSNSGSTARFSVEKDGTVCAAGDVIAYASDCRLKCNILTVTSALNKIKSIRGVEFEWDETKTKPIDFIPVEKDRTHGFIAQELQKVIPDAVVNAPFCECYLTVKPQKIIPVLVEAVKEQQCTIEKQQRQIDTLTCQVELLLKRCE